MNAALRIRHAATVLCLCAAVAAGVSGRDAVPGAADLTAVLEGTSIQDLSSAGLTLSFRLKVANTAASPRRLSRYAYRVTVNARTYLDLAVALDEPIPVPARGEAMIAVPVKITYALLTAAVGPVPDSVSCRLAGELYFRDDRGREEKVALDLAGDFPVFREPDLDFLPLRVKALTLGGADLAFRARFSNPNGYDLLADRIAYRLELAGTTVLEGTVDGRKDMPAGGSREIELPFILDFFEAGAEGLHAALESGAVPGRLWGEMEIASAWGRLRIPFDRRGTIVPER